MSITSTTSRVDYVGNGATATYDFPFLIFAEADLLVTTRDTDDVETTLALNTDYTVDGVADAAGGTITLVDGNLTSGYALTIRRVRDLTQETDIRNQGEFFPETLEDVFDGLTMVDQQQQDLIDRSVKLPETVSSDDFDPSLPWDIQSQAGGVLCVNATGDGFDIIPPTVAGTLDGEVVGNLNMLSNGGYIILRSPDGTKTIHFGVDNNGNFGDLT